MKCPYCETEMELGYIQCRDGVVWDTQKRMVAALPSFRKSSVKLGSESDGAFSSTSVAAYHCSNCKKIVIDYS